MPLQLGYKVIDTPFQYPFTISGGRTKSSQPSLLVSLSIGRFTGFGEAPAINYYHVTTAQMEETLLKHRKAIQQFALTDPSRYWHYLHHLLPQHPFLVAALDIACWDLFGKMHNQPLYRLWKTEWSSEIPLTDYTIGIDTPDQMLKKMLRHPWPLYKIKMDKPDDINILKELRRHTDAILRVDANGAWNYEDALILLPQLKMLGVQLVEQPLAKDDWDKMALLYQQSPLPIFADESCVFEQEVTKCVNHFHGINIKLTKCSGLTPALRMIQKARESNLKIMVGCMNETTIGSAAIAQLLPQIDYVDMDGPLLLADDVADGLTYDMGSVSISNTAGLGISLRPGVQFNY